MPFVKMTLTAAQFKKHTLGKMFQLSHKQLTGESSGKHDIELNIGDGEVEKLMKNIQMGKGFKFSSPMEGGSFDFEEHQKRYEAGGKKLKRDTVFRVLKGSDDALAWGEKMKQCRLAKKSGISSDDEIVGGSTYNERLARRTKNTFKKIGQTAVPILKDIGVNVIKNIGTKLLTTALMGGKLETAPYSHMIGGVPKPIHSRSHIEAINTLGLGYKHAGKNNLFTGGSFLEL
jgi:hypothetical protein